MHLLETSLRLSVASCVAFALAQTQAHAADERSHLSATPIAAQQLVRYDIPAQSLESALTEFAVQSKRQVIFDPHAVPAVSTPGLKGEFAPEVALERLLKHSGLQFRIAQGDTIVVTHENTSTVWRQSENFRLAQASMPNEGESASAEASATPDAQLSSTALQLEEIAVTGSRIRAVDRSVPLTVISREQIDAMGITTMDALLRRLPQNLTDVSQSTMGGYSGGPGTHITFDGTGVNLRGIGSSATLVLVNGRRSIAAGNGSFTDVSLIPFSAIERVEILTDGASAIYGSDAVGGVINFILREDYNARETTVSYGVATRGGAEQFMAAQSLASAWDMVGVRAHLEYSQASPVRYDERDFIDQQNLYFLGGDLVPSNEKLLANIGGEIEFTENLQLSTEAMYARREAQSYSEFWNGRVDRNTRVEQYGALAEIDYRLNSDWSIKVRPQYSVNTSQDRQLDSDAGYIVPYGNRLTSTSVDVDLSRALTAAGVGFVAGGQFRREGFEERSPFYPADIERDVAALYGELRLPIIKPPKGDSGRMELSLAGRYEDYEFAGSAFSPKIGLSWQAAPGLNLRTTWGESFKAPLLTQTNVTDVYGFIYKDFYNTADGGRVSAITLGGNSSTLEPERSKNHTVGFDFVTADRRTSVSATYFDIRYEDRIMAPSTYLLAKPGEELREPALAGLITLNPTQDQIEALMASTREVFCYDPGQAVLCDPTAERASLFAVIDTRLRNIAATRTRGIDFEGSRYFTIGSGAVELAVNGAYYLDQEQKLFATSPEVQNLLDEIYGTIDLRLRGSATYTYDKLSASLIVNYSDDYADTRGYYAPGPIRIASLTTIDVNAGYDLIGAAAPFGLQRLKLGFSAQNIFDKSPPWVPSDSGLHYDGVNADVIGRYVSLSITGAW